MKLTKYYSRIAELISLEITGDLNKSEKEELDKWLSSASENKQLYIKIRSELATYIKNNKKINFKKDIVWNKIVQETTSNKKPFIYLSLLKYAAVFFLAIATAGVIYFNYSNKKEPIFVVDYSVDSQLEPGSQKALLVMSNGSNIELNEEKKDSIREEDGSLIENNQNVLTYNNSESNNKTRKKRERSIFNTLITPKGGEYNLVLSDGTKVWLNADSRLKYPVQFSGNTREVELEGEAYFEVEKDINTPFIIKTSDYNIEVLGTVFNVWAYKEDDKVVTTLVEGSVKINNFDDSGNEILIKPQEQLILNKVEKGILIRKVDVYNYIAWKDGRFIFVKQNLEDILKIMSRWYNFEFEFESPDLKSIEFTGNMCKYDKLATPLEMIAKTNKVNFKIEDRKVLVTN